MIEGDCTQQHVVGHSPIGGPLAGRRLDRSIRKLHRVSCGGTRTESPKGVCCISTMVHLSKSLVGKSLCDSLREFWLGALLGCRAAALRSRLHIFVRDISVARNYRRSSWAFIFSVF